MNKNVIVCFFFALAIATTMIDHTSGVVTCQQAITPLLPCLSFFRAPGPATPSPQCCSAAQGLDRIAAGSRPDRQAICRCIKAVFTSGQFQINLKNAKAIVPLCRLSTNIPIDPKTNCDM
ncbi:non-specific lipid-transfer protein 1-like [Impatiens glandulifera]|uniref:non-specific lipid-transfer protein 1-like n=1 Tax=Impatiens glandulifera TaxID=253017 RepID=UPI001FB0E7F6|nr:non-specific lipid-transfer protein 1-like [Impatiens glandulifera]